MPACCRFREYIKVYWVYSSNLTSNCIKVLRNDATKIISFIPDRKNSNTIHQTASYMKT